jgi:CRP-like cAMP-binding protein
MAHKANLILDSLPPAERDALTPHLIALETKQHSILQEIRDTVTHAYFPVDAVISLVVPLSTGEIIETAMVGRDGVVGGATALDGRVALNRGVVQLGGHCLQIKADDLRAVAAKHPNLQRAMIAHEQVLLMQAQQSAACNATHVVESRLSKWLLRAADLRGSNELDLTQEYIAEMLGVRRTSVSLVANTLQAGGLIQYRRGHIRLVNIPALQETACECYEAVKLAYETLLHRRPNE